MPDTTPDEQGVDPVEAVKRHVIGEDIDGLPAGTRDALVRECAEWIGRLPLTKNLTSFDILAAIAVKCERLERENAKLREALDTAAGFPPHPDNDAAGKFSRTAAAKVHAVLAANRPPFHLHDGTDDVADIAAALAATRKEG